MGAFSGDFTTNLARQCRAFSGALKIEKLKAPLIRGPEGAGATNDWCITYSTRQNAPTDRVLTSDILKGVEWAFRKEYPTKIPGMVHKGLLAPQSLLKLQ